MIICRIKSRASVAVRNIALSAIATVLLGGCARLSASKVPKPRTLADMRIVEVNEDSETQRRIEAYSRFATGIHFELEDDPKAAASEFLQAAQADIKNEELVLDVSGRLIRDGKNEDAIGLLSNA
jgi:hypothetical protein